MAQALDEIARLRCAVTAAVGGIESFTHEFVDTPLEVPAVGAVREWKYCKYVPIEVLMSPQDYPDDDARFFASRIEAAQLLAKRLERYRGQNPLVLGVPRGAVPMAQVIAETLKGELDVVLVHKLGAPFQEELAIGSVSERGSVHLGEEVEMYGIERSYIDREVARQLDVLRRRRAAYTPVRPSISPMGRIVIVVDDGVATGWTMIAALRSIRLQKPAKLIAAIAVAPARAVATMREEADEVVCLATPADFYAVGQFFADFRQVTDEEVAEILARTLAAKGK
jgi:predicted phosphoribosyltransferase